MKKALVAILLIVIGLNFFKKEMVFYTPVKIPTSLMSMTIPPFGIFIEKKYKNEGNGSGSLLQHEKKHWAQYKRMGLIKFYFQYSKEFIKYGRYAGPMEKEARGEIKIK
jgi:hypothetical protein